MEGTILNYYPFKNFGVDEQKEIFWTMLVTKISDNIFSGIFLDQGHDNPSSPSVGTKPFNFVTTGYTAKNGPFSYVMHMNDTALLSNNDETEYFKLLEKLSKQSYQDYLDTTD